MLRIAICDDTPKEVENILSLTKGYLSHHGIEAEITPFAHPDELLSTSEKRPFDVYLLDIVMPMVDGITVGRELRHGGNTAQIIYLTTSDEFAVEAFSLQAAHYLIKPIVKPEFDKAMERALMYISQASVKTISIRTEGGTAYEININDILYIESMGHLQSIACKECKVMEARRSLTRLEEELQALVPGQFLSPYRGLLVNLRAVRMVNKENLLLKNGETLPLAKRCFREVRNAYFDFYFGKGEMR